MKIVTDVVFGTGDEWLIVKRVDGYDIDGPDVQSPIADELITRRQYLKILSDNPIIDGIPLRERGGWDIPTNLTGHDPGTTRWQILVWEIEAHGTDELKAIGLKA